MNCKWTLQHDIELNNGLLSDAVVFAYRQHLADCVACRNRQIDFNVLEARLVHLADQMRMPGRRSQIEAQARRTQRVKTWRLPAFRLIGWATAAVFIAWAVGLLPTPAKQYDAAQSAWAVIASRVQETQSVRMQLRFEGPGGVVMSGEILSTPERARIQEADGKIGVGEFASGRAIVIDESARRVIEWTEPLPIPNLYAMFRDLQLQALEPREEMLEGRPMLVFPARVLTENATIWVDSESRLPARIEYDKSMPANGEMIRGRVVASAIQWDQPFDSQLLSLEPPSGYTVVRMQPAPQTGPDRSESAENALARDNYMAGPLETRIKNLVFGCLVYVQNNTHDATAWPADMARIQRYCHTGTFRNPNRPELEVGFGYIRPTGQPRWDPPESRRLIFHEILADGDTGGWVSYTDGSAERIEDRARFDQLIAAARAASAPGE